VKLDGAEKTKIVDNLGGGWYWNINIVEEWIYYQNNSGIFRMYIEDGTDVKMLVEGTNHTSFGCVNVVNGYIYYTINDNDVVNTNELCKVDINGFRKQKLVDGCFSYFNVNGDWIYYCNENDGNKLYKVSTNGSGKKKLCEDECQEIHVVGEWVYYLKPSKKDRQFDRYRIRIDGAKRQKIKY
jgi:hypothetical protein